MKFKVWDIESRRWVKDDTALRCDGLLLIDNGFEWVSPADPDRFVVCLYTGLKDKNGVDIYDGDILKSLHFIDGKGSKYYLHHKITWNDRLLGWFALNMSSLDERDGSCQLFVYAGTAHEKEGFEVAGNIYETPELLKPA